jgi:hypothetical protein
LRGQLPFLRLGDPAGDGERDSGSDKDQDFLKGAHASDLLGERRAASGGHLKRRAALKPGDRLDSVAERHFTLSGGVLMRKAFGLMVMFGLLLLSLGSPGSALTPAQQACLTGCIGRDRSCGLNCAATQNPGCEAACNAELTACRKACLS